MIVEHEEVLFVRFRAAKGRDSRPVGGDGVRMASVAHIKVFGAACHMNVGADVLVQTKADCRDVLSER